MNEPQRKPMKALAVAALVGIMVALVVVDSTIGPADGFAGVCDEFEQLEMNTADMLDTLQKFTDWSGCSTASAVCRASVNRTRRDIARMMEIASPQNLETYVELDAMCSTQVGAFMAALQADLPRRLAHLNAMYPPEG